MTLQISFFIRSILVLSLVSSSLPATPTDIPQARSIQRLCFKEQALAAPALSDIHDAARRGSAVCVRTVELFRALPFPVRPLLVVGLALSAALWSPASSLKKSKATSTRLSKTLRREKIETVQQLAHQTAVNTFFVTPDFPHYQLRMAEKGTVKSIIPAGAAFQANKPVVEITQDPTLYQAEENAARRDVQDFDIMNERVDKLFQSGLMSLEEKQKHDAGRAIAKERLARAKNAVLSRLSFPFPGKVLHVWKGPAAEGTPYLEVSDSNLLVVTLSKPQAFLRPGGPAVDVVPLVQKGFSVALSFDGKPLASSNLSIEGETLKFFVTSSHWPEGQGRQIQLSIETPTLLNEEPAFPVHHRFQYDAVAQEDGTVNALGFFSEGSRLPTGPVKILRYDAASIDSTLRSLKIQRDNLNAMASRARTLAGAAIGSVNSYERLQNDLIHVEEEVSIAERQKKELEAPAFRLPWDAFVVQQPLLAQGQRIKKNDLLMTVGSSHQFEAVLLMNRSSAQLLKPMDEISVVLEGAQVRFPAAVRSINSSTSAHGDNQMEVIVDIQDDRALLRDGFRVHYEQPSVQVNRKSDQPLLEAYGTSMSQTIERIRLSTDYDWVRSAMNDLFKDPTISQDERAGLFNGIVGEQNLSDLYKEWALIKLVDMGRIDDLFHFVHDHQPNDLSLSPNVEDRRLFSFAFCLLHDQLYDVSLFNLPTLSKEKGVIDHYLASLMQRDPEKYSHAVELQMRWAQNSDRVLSRWLLIPDLSTIASDENFRRRGSIFLEHAQAPLIGKDVPMHKVLSALELYDNDFRRDQLAVGDYLTHGNKALVQTLSTMAPEFTTAVHPPTPTKTKKVFELEPLETFSNNAVYFSSPAHYGTDPRKALEEMSSPGSKTLAFELAAENDLALSQEAQDLIYRKDLVGLIHLFNHLGPTRQKSLLSNMASSGVLANIALYRETVSWDTSVDTVWAEFFRDFYRTALADVTAPLVRQSLLNALIRTYQTEIELARAAYVSSSQEDLKGLTDDEMASYHQIAQHDLRHRVANQLLIEHAEVLEQKAGSLLFRRQKLQIQAARTEALYAARLALESEDSGSGREDLFQLKELLTKAGVPLQDVEERMKHYENVFTPSGTTLWAAPQPFNGRIIGIALFLSTLLGLVLRRSKTSSAVTKEFETKATNASAEKNRENVLKLFAQQGDAAARSLYHRYQTNRNWFFALVGLRTIVTVFFIGFISFWELHGNGSEFFALYLGLVAIDQVFNVFLIRKREIFGELLKDLFPAQLKIDVERVRLSREPTPNASSVFSDPFRTANKFSDGQLLLLYSAGDLLGILATGVGLAFIHYGLAIGYVVLTGLFLVSFVPLSSKTSHAGLEKENLLNQWMQETVLLVKMGFSPEPLRSAYLSVSFANKRLIKEKMKYTAWLRGLSVLFPGVGALVGLPLSTLAIFRGSENLFFFPDLAKVISEWMPAKKSIRSFLLAHPRRTTVETFPNGVMPSRLELKNVSLVVPVSSADVESRDRYLIRNATLNFPIGTLHLISGENKSGKTTLLRVLAGLDSEVKTVGLAQLVGQTPSGETVTVNARDAGAYVHYFTPSDLVRGMIGQTLMDMLEGPDEKSHFRSWIDATDGLGDDFGSMDLSKLSRGQWDRVQLAFMLAKTKAPIIFVDEALAHMDKKSQRLWVKLMKDYAKRQSKLIIMAEKAVVPNPAALDGLFQLNPIDPSSNGNLIQKPSRKRNPVSRTLREAA